MRRWAQIVSLTSARDALAAQIRSALNHAAFDGERISDDSLSNWTKQADSLISQAIDLAL